MSKFDLERRAEELFRRKGVSPITFIGNEQAAQAALQLARELAEAIAAEIEGPPGTPSLPNVGMCADIARSFARPRTREDVYREALEVLVSGKYHRAAGDIAQDALDWRQP